jgi:hypothetical protein
VIAVLPVDVVKAKPQLLPAPLGNPAFVALLLEHTFPDKPLTKARGIGIGAILDKDILQRNPGHEIVTILSDKMRLPQEVARIELQALAVAMKCLVVLATRNESELVQSLSDGPGALHSLDQLLVRPATRPSARMHRAP